MLSSAEDPAVLVVRHARGTPVALGTLWRDRPAVLVLVRDFG